MVPRALMRGAGFEPTYGARKPMPVRPTRAVHDGEFFVDESGLSLTHLHVLEGIMLSAFAARELPSGELSLKFRPGAALREMGLDDGCRAWLRTRLKELGSPIGNLPRASGGGDFSVLRTMATDTPAGRLLENVITGADEDGKPVLEATYAKVWTVRLSNGYRDWLASQASLRHSWLRELKGLKCAAAEAVARYALTGACNIAVPDLLLTLGVLPGGWDSDTDSSVYQAARRAIRRVVALADKLAPMGIMVAKDSSGVVRVIAENMPSRVRFFQKATPATPKRSPDERKGAKGDQGLPLRDESKASRFQLLAERLATNAGQALTATAKDGQGTSNILSTARK